MKRTEKVYAKQQMRKFQDKNSRFKRQPIFTRRFMKWNTTIIVTFFQSTRTDQNSSTKFYKILRRQIVLFGIGNWTIGIVFLA